MEKRTNKPNAKMKYAQKPGSLKLSRTTLRWQMPCFLWHLCYRQVSSAHTATTVLW